MEAGRKIPVRKAVAHGGRTEYGRGAERRARRQFLRFMACGAAFVLLVAAKLWGPEHAAALRRTIGAAIEKNMDVQEVFASVGRTFAGESAPADGLREVWRAVFLPDGAAEASETGLAEAVADADAAQLAESVAGTDAAQLAEAVAGTDAAQLAESVAGTEGGVSADAASNGGNAESAGGVAGDAETLTPYHWEGSFGNSTAFASLSEPWPEASEAVATAGSVTTPSDGNAFEDTHPDPQTPILYTGQNLPENVGMQQVLLNFDYQCPVQGALTSGFGYRQHPIDGVARFHYGVDIAAETGTAIVCFADGVVTATGESTSFGKYCTVEHGGGFTTLYAHCSRVTAVSGASVRMGDKLAEVGATGQATGPHLHFALQREGIYLNPVYYLAG